MSNPQCHLSALWAKLSKRKVEPATYHPLICHCLDVGAVALALWDEVIPPELRSRTASRLGIAEQDARSWIAFWAAAHDTGKLSPAFQLQDVRAEIRLRAVGMGERLPAAKAPHGAVSALALSDLLPGYGLAQDVAGPVATLVGGHHGVFPRSETLQDLRYQSAAVGKGPWKAARAALVEMLAGALRPPREAPSGPMDNATAMVVAGLVSVADWIGSDERSFPHRAGADKPPPRIDPTAYLLEAQDQAREALDRLGWRAWPCPDRALSFPELFGIAEPNPLQAAVIDLARKLDAPALVILEAPMGEGKTEAALYLADRWAVRLGRNGCYVALPTQATSNQMFGRVREYLERRYAGQAANLQLLHGHAALSAEFDLLRRKADHLLDPAGVQGQGGYDGAPAGVLAAEWFTHRKRGLLAPFGVGTVDQALLASLQTRHVFVRLFGLAGKTVILDEVHAYDTYMTELLDRLLEWLGALGSSVLLLSATLPGERRRKLAEAYCRGLGCPLEPADLDQPYPRVAWVGPASAGARHVGTSDRASKKVRQQWVDGRLPADPSEPFGLGEKLKEALAGGGCAAVICNTVGRAQEVYRALKPYFPGDAGDGAPELDLLHSRYLFEDRERREKRALLRFGKPGGKVEVGEGVRKEVLRPRRAVLVATQIIEQSLDLDFDLMVSDPAPADLVLQRVGRLHRHRRDAGGRHGLLEPALWLCRPEVDQSGVPAFDDGTTAVYDGHVLLRSWLALKDCSVLRIPEEVESLIESVYDLEPSCPPDLSTQLTRRWAETLQRHVDDGVAESKEAQDRWLKRPGYDGPLWRFTADPREEDSPDFHPAHQALTRLADPTVPVVCLYQVGGRQCLDPDGVEPIDPEGTPTTAQAEHLLRRSVAISHRGAVPWLLEQPAPGGWRHSGLLRHHRLLALDVAGSAAVGRYRLQVDPEVGVTLLKG